jgi:hypothetical protein
VKVPVAPRRVARRLTYANVVATLALMIAISGGTAYAASRLITGKQIAKGAITAKNIKKHSLSSVVFKKGTIRRGKAGATGASGATGATGATGAGLHLRLVVGVYHCLRLPGRGPVHRSSGGGARGVAPGHRREQRDGSMG